MHHQRVRNGFGEAVSGVLSVVAMEREAALLGDVSTLHSQLTGLKRELRKAEKSDGSDDLVPERA